MITEFNKETIIEGGLKCANIWKLNTIFLNEL